MDDLVVLVADRDMEAAIRGALNRPRALSIRGIQFTLYRHPRRDPGCRVDGAKFLRALAKQFAHAIVMFDYEGSGTKLGVEELEATVEGELSKEGWASRGAAVVIEPELEAWIWSDSPWPAAILGWPGKEPALRVWLEGRGFLSTGQLKPARPKEALEAALFELRRPRSSVIYGDLARAVSLDRCVDRAFLKFKKTLQAWFPLDNT
jgi:hypothetical protein